jgi:hypothetical protein
MKKILLPLLAVFALICGFTACGSTDFLTAGLKIELSSIERASDGAVRVTWRVQNPNVFSYLLDKTSHKLSLNGTLVGTITDNSPLGVPAQSHAERTEILTPTKPPAGTVIDQAVAQGSASYRLDSTLNVLLLDDKFEKISLTGSGTVPVTAK